MEQFCKCKQPWNVRCDYIGCFIVVLFGLHISCIHCSDYRLNPVSIIQEWIYVVCINADIQCLLYNYTKGPAILVKTQWVSNIFLEVTLTLLQVWSLLLILTLLSRIQQTKRCKRNYEPGARLLPQQQHKDAVKQHSHEQREEIVLLSENQHSLMPEKTRFKGTYGDKSTIGTLFKALKVCLYLEVKIKRDSESVNSVTQWEEAS